MLIKKFHLQFVDENVSFTNRLTSTRPQRPQRHPKVYFPKVYFPKVFFLKEYIFKVCFSKVYYFPVYFSKVYLSKKYFCEMYPTCVSSKLCEFILMKIILKKGVCRSFPTLQESFPPIMKSSPGTLCKSHLFDKSFLLCCAYRHVRWLPVI